MFTLNIIVLTMRDLSILFFLISIMTKTSEATRGNDRYDDNSSQENTHISATVESATTSLEIALPEITTAPSTSSPIHSEASSDSERDDDKSSQGIADIPIGSSTPPTTPGLSPSSPTHAVPSYRDIAVKCKHLYKVVTHMKLTALQLDETKHWSSLIKEIREYNVIDPISSLYNRSAYLIGSLWDFYLYKHWLKRAEIHNLKNDIIQQKRVITVHRNVIKSLENDLKNTNCPEDHKDNSFSKWRKDHPKPKAVDITAAVKRNQGIKCWREMKGLFCNKVKLNDALEPETLFVRVLGDRDRRLMNFDFINVNWTGTSRVLKNIWDGIWFEFDVTVEHYEKIKSYFTLHNDFVNIIFVRLCWRHLLCIEQISDKKQKLSYGAQLIALLNDYKQLLVIQDDPNLNYLSNVIEDTANKKVDLKETISQLKTIIEPLCSSLQCLGVADMDLKTVNQNTIMALNADKEIDFLNVRPDEIDPLFNVKDFLNELRGIFKDMHLDVTRTFLSHIYHSLHAPDKQIKQN
ncbi:uncharacterized protein LOC126843124 isoform X2 [Adelges cooleyi]|uniref:uncharacterized protein LOC126843124 isoform X2 n=1 Tax=Adelges cooleyi TaxID=133065 RepID=UPI0021800AA4|nr:uncharacterized protein LOC126843124 isoform X2 [Adelges cooleyi]